MEIISNNVAPAQYANQATQNLAPLSGSRSQSGYQISTSSSYSDKVSISEDAQQISVQEKEEKSTDGERTSSTQNATDNDEQLTDDEKQEVLELKRRDTEVKTHEQAHLAAAGQHAAGGPSYTYTVGPDGKRYAIAGEVPIDMSKEPTPEATVQKMQIVRSAAMAPRDPSAADRRIAARASMIASQARREIQSEATTQQDKTTTSTSHAADSQIGDNNTENSTGQNQGSSSFSPLSRRMILSAYQAQVQ